MKDEEFVKNYLMILEYFKPKQQRREINATHKVEANFSLMTTDELKERAEALKKINDTPTTSTT